MKKYVVMFDPNGHLADFREVKDEKEALSAFIREARDRDWHHRECAYDDRWPELKILTVSEETEVDIKEALKEEETRATKMREKYEKQHRRAEYEALKKEFEGK